jgi:hypothetical protein
MRRLAAAVTEFLDNFILPEPLLVRDCHRFTGALLFRLEPDAASSEPIEDGRFWCVRSVEAPGMCGVDTVPDADVNRHEPSTQGQVYPLQSSVSSVGSMEMGVKKSGIHAGSDPLQEIPAPCPRRTGMAGSGVTRGSSRLGGDQSATQGDGSGTHPVDPPARLTGKRGSTLPSVCRVCSSHDCSAGAPLPR